MFEHYVDLFMFWSRFFLGNKTSDWGFAVFCGFLFFNAPLFECPSLGAISDNDLDMFLAVL